MPIDVSADRRCTLSNDSDPLRGALIDSRQRWRDLVLMVADLAFETDAQGRLTFVIPDPAIGWQAGTLIGQPASLLLAGEHATASFDPFHVTAPVRRRRTWLKRGDGGVTCLSVTAAPMLDADGTIMGVRGIAIDVTAMDARVGQAAASLRRGEVLDHILAGIGREVLAPRMMQAALTGLSNAMGAEGAAVIVIPPGKTDAVLAHRAGDGGQDILSLVSRRLPLGTVSKTVTMEGRPALLAGCQTRFGAHGAIAVWRTQDARAWDEDDQQILGSAANLIRMVLEHEAIQQEMHRQARTDPLTGLLNRRAFLEEVERHIERLEKEELPGTLLFADLDHFKPVNDALGHEVGDQALVHLAALLRRVVRPTDLIARLGGDEFAVWMSGADHMTAAERADALRELVPRELGEIVGSDVPRLSVSIGIACRSARSRESLESLIRRADMAMYEVKRHGRGHWRVSLQEPRA